MSKIGIIGAGAFGTGLAGALAHGGNDIVLWGRDAKQMSKMASARQNIRYLPKIPLPDGIHPTADISDLNGVDAILMVTPAQRLRDTLTVIDVAQFNCPTVLCAKGIETDTGLLQSEIAAQYLPAENLAALSGPGFAVELAKGMPTALTLAAVDAHLGAKLQRMLSTQSLRLYQSQDIRGVQLGGALKNVFAIACGIVVGANLGESARAALITRGFSELSRLAQAMGGQAETLIGLSGFGDLTLSCTSIQSRNFAFGHQLAQSGNLKPGQTVEGIATALATVQLAIDHSVDMPIAGQVAQLLSGKLTVDQALRNLMDRPLRPE